MQIEELLQQALDLHPHLRAEFLKQACGGDPSLLANVEALLKRETQAGSFMESPAIASLPRHAPPARISHYRIEKRVGAGGMGEVFKAHDENLRRVVALKMLPAEFISDAERIQRFEQEAFAASRLNHPNIITIFEITHTSDEHFIVQEFVEGRTLRELLRDPGTKKPSRLELERALEIAVQIARALKAAHTAWIIHRDIKPENIMVRDDGLVKVLDFGIAKLGDERASASNRDNLTTVAPPLNDPALTIAGAIMGTASYMSPEQARGEPLDGRTDLFSLGVVLYEMVTGVQLFAGAARTEVLERLKLSDEVVGPGFRFGRIPKELQRILRRALRSDRDERYASASELLDDLTRLKARLENRTMRRIVRISALAVIAALAVVAVTAYLSVNETWQETVFRDGHTAAVRRAVFSPDGKLLISAGEDYQVIVWDFARRMPVKTLSEHKGVVTTIAFSPDGRWFFTGSEDETAILWNAESFEKQIVWHDHPAPIITASFSSDGSLLAYARKDGVVIRETKTWTKVRELPCEIGSYGTYVFLQDNRWIADNRANAWDLSTGEQVIASPPAWYANWIAASPDESHLATIDPAGIVRVVDLTGQQLLHANRAHHDHGRSIAYSPDGKLIASAAERVLLWDAATNARIAPLEYESIVWSLAFSPDGRWLVSTHGDGSILVWDVVNRELEANLRQHSGGVRAIAFSPDGKRLATASEDQSVIIWNAENGRKDAVLNAHETRVAGVVFSPDGTWLASADQTGQVIRHDVGRNTSRRFTNARKDFAAYFVAISPDGRFVATSFAIYDAESGAPVHQSEVWRGVYSASFTRDGTRLFGATDDGEVLVLDGRTWQVIEQQKWTSSPIVTLSLSPDESRIVTGDDGKMIRLGTVQPLRQIAVIGQHSARVKAVAFAPDGEQVVSAGDDKMVAFWDVDRRKLVTTIGTHTSPIYGLALSPDGKRLFTAEHDRSVRQYTRHRSLWGFWLD